MMREFAADRIDSTNVAHTAAYLRQREEEMARLFGHEFASDEPETRTLSGALRWIYVNCEADFAARPEANGGWPLHMNGSINEIVNGENEVIYRYCGVDDEAAPCTAIAHPDGNTYIFFRRELYGYSVLNLTTMEDFHYAPAESFVAGGETFILCTPHFDTRTRMLAVEGCIWAAPYSVMLMDFAEPMHQARQVDVNEYLTADSDEYLPLDFVRWDEDALVVRSGYNAETFEEHVIPIAICAQMLRRGAVDVDG